MHTSIEQCEIRCFEILGIAPTRDLKIIKKAYHNKAKTNHPDIEGGSEELMKEVQFAFEFLTNDDVKFNWAKKNIYDLSKLNLTVGLSVSFEEVFFGTKVKWNYNIIEYDEKDIPIDHEILVVDSIDLDIPAGSFQGHQVHASGRGYKFKEFRGDLLITVTPRPHPRYQVDGENNIHSRENVDLNLMLSGGKLTVQTMMGLKVITLKPATAPGTSVQIPGAGFKGTNHVVQILPRFPTEQELKEEKWKNFKVDWGSKKEIDDDAIEAIRYRIKMNGEDFTNFNPFGGV